MKEVSDGRTEARFGIYVKFWVRKDVSSEIGEKKVRGRPPSGTRLPTLALEIVESRVIAHLKAENEKNAVESSVGS